MSVSRTVRLAAAAALGLAAGGVLWARASEIEPFLAIQADRVAHNQDFEWWQVTFRARGGETIDGVRIEPGTGDATLPPEEARLLPSLRAGWSSTFKVLVSDRKPGPCSVRLVQLGRVPRTYEVPLEEKRP